MLISVNMDVVRREWSDQARMALERWYHEHVWPEPTAPFSACVTSITMHAEGSVAITCPCTPVRIYDVGTPPPIDLHADGVTIQR